ncbi:MAG: hypothetical protein Q8M99_08965 [Methylotenera sp.]|nr:hypothetical protein [Methylotenera sp.]
MSWNRMERWSELKGQAKRQGSMSYSSDLFSDKQIGDESEINNSIYQKSIISTEKRNIPTCSGLTGFEI